MTVSEQTTPGKPTTPKHIELEEHPPVLHPEGEPSPGMRNDKGWDGKLRVSRPSLVNPEALSDPEYSDDENVLPGEVINADENLLDGEPLDTDEIIVSHSRISSVPSLKLERFKSVARICFRQNCIQEIDGISCLAATLKDLDMYDNLITRIRGLDDLVNLTSLDLSFNKIRHIKHIDHLKDLRELFLVANKISTIEGLDGLDKLTSLELGSNRIREIQNLESLAALEELWVAKNKISQLTGLGGLPNLRLLSIQSNRIRDLSPLAEVPGLEELYISHNALESLKGIENNTKLRVIDISNNQIASLEGLGPLADLEELWASYNQIADIGEIEKLLREKEKLTTVYFEGNPVQLRAPALYRNKVRLALPQVVQIDATYVKV